MKNIFDFVCFIVCVYVSDQASWVCIPTKSGGQGGKYRLVSRQFEFDDLTKEYNAALLDLLRKRAALQRKLKKPIPPKQLRINFD